MNGPDKTALYILEASGYIAQSDWDAAARVYRFAHQEGGCIARCARVTKKLREKERNVVLDAEDIINGTIDIELDE